MRIPENLTSNTVYNRQWAVMIFTLALAYKATVMPRMLSGYVGSSVVWLTALITAIEAVCYLAVYGFIKKGGDRAFSVERKSSGYALLCITVALYLIFKTFFLYCTVVNYVTKVLFESIAPLVIVLTLVVPVAYMAHKGMQSLARLAEISFAFVVFFVGFELFFLDTDMDLARNLPVLAAPPQTAFDGLARMGVFFGDALPFMFLSVKKRKLPYLAIGGVLTAALIIVIAMLAVAIYGNSLFMVDNALVDFATYNEFAMTLGRLEWTGIISFLIAALIYLAVMLWGAAEAAARAIDVFRTKVRRTEFSEAQKSTVKRWTLLILEIVLIVATGVQKNLGRAFNFCFERPVGYTLTAVGLLLPIIAFFAACAARKNRAQNPTAMNRLEPKTETDG